MGAFIIPQNRSESNMFSYQVDIYEKQNEAWGWRTLTGWTRPFTDGTRLDETLDSGTINLSCVTRQKAIKPFTRLRIIVSENGTEKERIYRLVASSRRTRRKYAGTPLYDWTINTIEPTKLLERRLIDTMTVSKYLSKNKAEVQYKAPEIMPVATSNQDFRDHASSRNFNGLKYLTPYLLGATIDIYNPSRIIAFSDYSLHGYNGNPYVEITSPGGEITTFTVESPSSNNDNIIGTYTLTENGTYKIKTYLDVSLGSVGQYRAYGSIDFFVSAYIQNMLPTQPTISSVCRRLLSAGVTRRKGVESQEFLLDPTFASEYAEMLAPEFSFTNCTLFEALLQVGGYIHSIPRLVPRSISDDTHYYVTFDKLGGDEQAPTMPPLIYSESTIDVNDWCGQIDTPAQNLVNTEDVTGGAITELGNSFITVRTEDGQVEINADDVLIRVSKPIQQIVKVECGFVDGTLVGDITPYIYENAEYKTLSSYWGSAYPYSKAWALYYTQGGNTIEGLSFRWQDKTSDETAFANYAIANIINAVAGTSLTWKDTDSGQFMRKLAFRVTYVPIAQARVKAHKPSLVEGGAVNNALTYNQSANIAETSYYGEKMRGAIARLGHDVETRTYDIFHYDQLPKIGQLLDGKYIAHIDYEWDITKVRITVALTKDFNMLSQFVGLNSNYRLYDISEKQSVERNVNYDEVIVLSKTRPQIDMRKYMMMRDVGWLMSYELRGTVGATIPGKMSVCRLTPYDANGSEILNRRVILPAVAFPFGTSIALNVSYFDNYGAGYQQSNAYESTANKSVQRLVPYTDSFGEIAGLKVSFDNSTGWTQSGASAYDDGSPAMMYPQLLTADTGSQYVTTGDYLLNVQKDSREILNFTYQLHFVTTDSNLVISSGLARYNPLVKGSPTFNKRIVLIFKQKTINGLNRYVEVESGDRIVEQVINEQTNTNVFVLNGRQYGSGYQNIHSYAYCVEVTVGNQTKYELLFGENFANGMTKAEIDPLYFSGAIMQACNQDEPTRLKFAAVGTSYYQRGSLFGWQKVGELAEDVIPDFANPSTYNSNYYPVDVGGTKYYVNGDDLVSAYDFE